MNAPPRKKIRREPALESKDSLRSAELGQIQSSETIASSEEGINLELSTGNSHDGTMQLTLEFVPPRREGNRSVNDPLLPAALTETNERNSVTKDSPQEPSSADSQTNLAVQNSKPGERRSPFNIPLGDLFGGLTLQEAWKAGGALVKVVVLIFALGFYFALQVMTRLNKEACEALTEEKVQLLKQIDDLARSNRDLQRLVSERKDAISPQ